MCVPVITLRNILCDCLKIQIFTADLLSGFALFQILQIAASCPHLHAGCQKHFDLRIRKNNRSDVAAIHDNISGRSNLLLQSHHLFANLWNRAYNACHIADFFGADIRIDILSIQQNHLLPVLILQPDIRIFQAAAHLLPKTLSHIFGRFGKTAPQHIQRCRPVHRSGVHIDKIKCTSNLPRNRALARSGWSVDRDIEIFFHLSILPSKPPR